MESHSVTEEEEIRTLLIAPPPSTQESASASVEIEAPAQHVVKMSIFSVSGEKKRSRERRTEPMEIDCSALKDILLFVWSGHRYSGTICVILSSIIYGCMGLMVNWFSVSSIPPFETIFIRCLVILVAAIIWIKKSGQSLFGLPHVRHLLVARAVTGYLSLLGFFYSVEVLQLCDAIVINFTTPLMATILAIFLLEEKPRVIVIGGMLCSFIGIFLIYGPIPFFQGMVEENKTASNPYLPQTTSYRTNMIIALISAVIGGAKYCFIRGAAKASDQPLTTVFAFAAFACPAAAVCMISFQQFKVPSVLPFIGTAAVGAFAFFAEILLARGLQLEKTSKATSILFFQAPLSYLLGIIFFGEKVSVLGFTGAAVIVVTTIVMLCFQNDDTSEL